MAKDKKKKKKDRKAAAVGAAVGKATKGLRTMSKNPIMADIVASALVATAAALKDANKARRLAADAGDELETLAKKGVERGNAMWQLALEIGRKALDEVSGEAKAPKRARTAAKPARPKAKKAAVAPKKAVRKPRTSSTRASPKRTSPKK